MGTAMAAAAVLIILCYSIVPSFVLRHCESFQRKKKDRGRTLCLTFDDGPSREYTDTLLDLLKKYDIQASFFVVADFALQNPDIIRRAREEGHLIGIHSVYHENALYRGNKFVFSDLAGSVFALRKLGCEVSYYRPPWGHLNLCTLYWIRRLNLRLVFWDVMAQDWAPQATAAVIWSKIMKRVYPGAVICLHDGRGAKGAPGQTIEALKKALPELLAEGYEFKRLDAYE